jgi:asparagine synthase (glutamine-hydrolysing)
MCGIAGIVSSDPEQLRRLPAAVAAIAHRGPDDEGIEWLDGAALGHRRLSIIDLAGGHQPMLDAEKKLAVVFNGEIYNFPKLKTELEGRGRRFTTRSDTEVLLHLYEEYGDDCVKRLDGMFAFGLWDAQRKRLLLARDHIGQKPMFFARTPHAFAFASEVKGVLATGLVKRELDLTALYHYISLRTIPDRHTLVSGVEKLPAGHIAVFENGECRVSRYWSFSFRKKMDGTEAQILDRLDQRLQDTVKEHLLSDVRVGAFLSGGVDSSLITAIMATKTGQPVPTFSIGVREDDYNELPFARLVAAQYRTEHHEEIAQADLLHLVPKMIWHLDEPADPFGVGVFLASRLASKHVKVVLSGDGGDELFAGYDRFSGQRLAEFLRMVPAGVRRTAVRGLINALPEGFGYKATTQKLRWLNEMSLLRAGDRYAESMSFLRFTEDAKRRLFTQRVRDQLKNVDSRTKILEHFDSDNADELIDRMLYTDLMTRMPDHLLTIVDRMAMAHGLEVRPPLLEHRMVEFAAEIPSSLKLKGTTLKYALRRVAARYIDPSLVTRRKQGFGFPIAQWLRGEMSGFLRHVVEHSRLIEMGVFEAETVSQLVDEHLDGKRDHNFRLWILMNLEIWHRILIEGQSVDSTTAWVEEHAQMTLAGAAPTK